MPHQWMASTAQPGSWLASAVAVAVASLASKAALRSSRLASGWQAQRWLVGASPTYAAGGQ